jgi:hypothetical protein
MIVDESLPCLRRRPPPSHHTLTQAGFANSDSEFQQLAVNAWSAPERLVAAHSAKSWRSSSGSAGRPGLPSRVFHIRNRRKPLRCRPTMVEGFTMMAADFPILPGGRKPDPRSLSVVDSFGRLTERWSTADLVTQRQDLQLERRTAPEPA